MKTRWRRASNKEVECGWDEIIMMIFVTGLGIKQEEHCWYSMIKGAKAVYSIWCLMVTAQWSHPAPDPHRLVTRRPLADYRWSSSGHRDVNEWALSGQRVNLAWSTNFWAVYRNGWRGSAAPPSCKPRTVIARFTWGKHASNGLSSSGPLATRAWTPRQRDDPVVTLRSWFSERMPIQIHMKNTNRSRRGGTGRVPDGSSELVNFKHFLMHMKLKVWALSVRMN